jgi:hypothetical protein
MRCRSVAWTLRRAAPGLLVLALLTALMPGPALAADQLIPRVGSGEDAPLVEQVGPPAPGPSAGQLISTTQFVEDPTRQAGGEDDAQRVNDRTVDQRNDDGDHRRK